ncbi:MAG: hypothetical protein AAF125_09015, partial [Chloroflexota bacterium]
PDETTCYEVPAVIQAIRVNNCVLEIQQGGVWTPVAGFDAACFVGPPGPPGADGADGRNGVDGRDGIDGRDGRDGIDGQDATPGQTPSDSAPVSVPSGTSNTNDAIFGASMALVQWLYEEALDVLNAAEGFTDTVDIVNSVLESVPLFGNLYDISGFDDFVSAVSGIGELGRPAVEASYDVTLQRDMACDLYCAIKGNDDVFESSIMLGVQADWVQGNPPNPARNAIALTSDYFLKTAFRFPSREYVLNLNNPDGDWATLCQDCPEDAVFTVSARRSPPGQSSGLEVVPGETYTFDTDGTWHHTSGTRYDANGSGQQGVNNMLRPDLSVGRLLWRVGTSGQWNDAGASGVISPTTSGTLYFVMNDNGWGQGSGAIEVTLSRQ